MKPVLLKAMYACCIAVLPCAAGPLPAQQPAPLVVVHGTPVQLVLRQQVSSVDGTAGAPVAMQALDDLVVDGRLIVRKGAPVTASLLKVEKKSLMTAGGRVYLDMEDVATADGGLLALNTVEQKGAHVPNHTVYKTLVIASMIALSPAGAVTSMALRGQEIVLPEGTEMQAWVQADTPLDAAQFPTATPPAAPLPANSLSRTVPSGIPAAFAPTQPPAVAKLALTTNAGDGSVFVDGEFRGEAPLTLDLRRGLRSIFVRRDGYKLWKEKVVVEGDQLQLLVSMTAKRPKQ
jgi:hypothetical protein